MSSQDQARVSVRIMEKEYVVACPYEERSALLDAAEFLNGRMREIRDSGKVVGLDRIAVMVALNIATNCCSRRGREARRPRVRPAARSAPCASASRRALERAQQLEL